MIRRISAILLALPVAAAGSRPLPWRRIIRRRSLITAARRRLTSSEEQLPPPPGARYQRYYQPPIQGGQPQRVLPYPDDEVEASMPPPGFATPNGGPPPGYGHQLDQQQMQRQQVQQIAPQPAPSGRYDEGVIRPPGAVGSAPGYAPVRTGAAPAQAQRRKQRRLRLMPRCRRRISPSRASPRSCRPISRSNWSNYDTKEPAGTIIVDTPHTYLYLVLGHGQAIRYGIGVGREGFTWTGTERISKMKEWPDWFPPAEMIERQPYLPRMMAGGPGNPLGARALYLGHTLYRIHGTNQPSTIGQYCVVGLHPPAQRGHRGSVQPRAGRHPRRGAAGQCAGDGRQYRRAAGRRRSAAAQGPHQGPASIQPSKAAPRCRVRRCRPCASASFHFQNS